VVVSSRAARLAIGLPSKTSRRETRYELWVTTERTERITIDDAVRVAEHEADIACCRTAVEVVSVSSRRAVAVVVGQG